MIQLSPYVIAIVASLVISQALKYLIILAKGGKFDYIRQSYASGNMPSTHSALVVSVLVVIGLKDGTESGLFGVALMLAIIVLYDSVMLRRSVGDQGIAVQALIKVMKSAIVLPHAAKGHTPLELLAGATLGALIGVVVFFATN